MFPAARNSDKTNQLAQDNMCCPRYAEGVFKCSVTVLCSCVFAARPLPHFGGRRDGFQERDTSHLMSPLGLDWGA